MTVDFSLLQTWFDELSPADQLEISAAAEKVRVSDERLLPASHGDTMALQLAFGEKLFLEMPIPGCLIRLGDCELSLLNAGFPDPGRLPWDFAQAGYARGAITLRGDLIRAVRETPLLGLQQNWSVVRHKTSKTLALLGIEVPPRNAVEVHLPYHLLVSGTLFRYLARKRVVLIGAHAEQLHQVWKAPGFVNVYRMFGPIDEVTIAGVVATPDRERGAWALVDEIVSAAARIDHDVSLIACGLPAKVIAWRLWQLGRTALDVGYVFDALLGTSPWERVERPVLKDAFWPNRIDR
jgi:hypothetical protein